MTGQDRDLVEELLCGAHPSNVTVTDRAAARIQTLSSEIDRLREELAEAYIKLSGKSLHTSDCATSYAPAMEPGPCTCDAPGDTQ